MGDEQPVQMDPSAVINGARFQDFTDARIYHSPTTKTHSVSEPFRTAINKLDFTREFGLPITKVIEQTIKPLLPRKWQKFKGRCDAMWFFSSMEVTSASPAKPDSPAEPDQLWVATPDLPGVRRARAVSPSARTPTVWQPFPCNSPDGPCNMTLPKVSRRSRQDLDNLCKGGGSTEISIVSPLIPSPFPWETTIPYCAWRQFYPKEIIILRGNIADSYLSGTDWAWNHTCVDVVWPLPEVWGEAGVDWDIFVSPDPAFLDRLQEFHSQHPNRRPDVEVEYEWCLVGWPPPKDETTAKSGIIEKGDKVYVAGRFIADCAHDDPYHTEIHPPAAMITAHTDSGVYGPQTTADLVYFDWWYAGESAEFDLYPPPRLEPDELPLFSLPVWLNLCKQDGGKCGIESTLQPRSAPNHLHIKISRRPDAGPGTEDSACQLHYGHNPCCCNIFKCGSAKRPVYVNVTRPIVGTFTLRWD